MQFIAAILGLVILFLMIGAEVTAGVTLAVTLTPGDIHVCNIAGISRNDCVKVIQQRPATEASSKLEIKPETANYVVQIVTDQSTTWRGSVDLSDINGTGPQNYTAACTTTSGPGEYFADAKIVSSADNPPSLTLNLLYNGQIINSTKVHEDFVDANVTNSRCPTTTASVR